MMKTMMRTTTINTNGMRTISKLIIRVRDTTTIINTRTTGNTPYAQLALRDMRKTFLSKTRMPLIDAGLLIRTLLTMLIMLYGNLDRVN